MDKLAEQHAERVTFIVVNTKSIDDAKSYKSQKNLQSAKLNHATTGREAFGPYGLKYIPHMCLIGKDGIVVKNFDNVDLSADVPKLL
jgi:hypothetical protein